MLVQNGKTHRFAWVEAPAHIPTKGEEARSGLRSHFRVLLEPVIHPEVGGAGSSSMVDEHEPGPTLPIYHVSST